VSRIVAAASALPANTYPQTVITTALESLITSNASRWPVMRRLHSSSRVDTRHFVMPLERYAELDSFQETNDLFISEGADLAERALREALRSSGLDATDIDFLLFTSVTGVAAPSIDALLATRLGMRSDVKRLPSFGLGCVAGAAGLARVHDYLVGHPDDVAVLVSLELCSLTLQRDDDSMANLVASGLFGDGAAAVVVTGSRKAETLGIPGPEIIATRSRLYADTEDILGWDIGGTGFRIVLGAGVPQVIDENFKADAVALLAENGLTVPDIGRWIAHPGGPKILEAFSHALELPDDAFDASWRALAEVGNLSSAAVLHILAGELLPDVVPGTTALLFAVGPGVTAELVLLRWSDETGRAAAADSGAVSDTIAAA
jgi:alkylresorcinol/alkylpyrone synthase